jgi:hypothetical protein
LCSLLPSSPPLLHFGQPFDSFTPLAIWSLGRWLLAGRTLRSMFAARIQEQRPCNYLYTLICPLLNGS